MPQDSLQPPALPERIAAIHRELLIPQGYYLRGLPFYDDARELVAGDHAPDGAEMLMEPLTARQWQAMKAAAQTAGVALQVCSSFRSIERQTAVIRRELAKGPSLDKVLRWVAAPGYSEHHTGRAIDIGCPGCFPPYGNDSDLEAFERTSAFSWLKAHATEFGFVMSYPRGNPHGIGYEPWHWCFHAEQVRV